MQDKVKEALEQLEQGISKLTSSEEWATWLKAQASFHHYSINNVILILMQMPHASRVASYETWRKLGRWVRKGEKAIAILAPVGFRFNATVIDKDQETGEQKERKIRSGANRFKCVPVFDVSQTDGPPLPKLARQLQGDDDNGLFDQLQAWSESRGVPVKVEATGSTANGYYDPAGNFIVISPDLAPVQQVKTLAHEISHSLLHRDADYRHTRPDCELEAESVAYVVLHHFGVDSGDYSFGYVAGWQGGGEKAIKALKATAANIQKAARDIIDGLEKVADREAIAA